LALLCESTTLRSGEDELDAIRFGASMLPISQFLYCLLQSTNSLCHPSKTHMRKLIPCQCSH